MRKRAVSLGGIFLLLITACSPWSKGNVPFDETDSLHTQSAATVESMLTQSADIPDPSTQTPVISLPTETPPPTASPTQPAGSRSFCDWVAFVKDVSIPDGTVLSAGSSFVKTWRLKNTGTCAWTSAYSLIFSSGDQMNGPLSVSLPGNVLPGETVDISVTLTTPASAGRYTGYWMLRNDSGVNFGYGDQANKAFFVKITSSPQSDPSKSLLVWTNAGGSPCKTAVFTAETLAYGECTGDLVTISSRNTGHLQRLLELVGTYAPFTAQAAAGTVTLYGTGSKTATWAEQRAIIEWARYQFLVAESGRGGAAWGLAFTWHREGGIAAFWDDVTVYVTGLAYISSRTGSSRQIYLNASQLEQVYGWVDTIKNIDYFHTDTDITDPMTISLVLNGTGNRQATQAEIQAISNFASSLVASTPVSGGGYPPGVLAAQNAVKVTLSAPADVIIIRFDPVDWPDTCLGIPRSDELCAQVITPGFRVLLVANGLLYEFHTDFEGRNVRSAGAPQPYPLT